MLCPSKKGEAGTVNLNKILQSLVNPPSDNKNELNSGFRLFREGDKVLQIKNNYDIHWDSDKESGEGIFNGDIGIIEKIDLKSETAFISFDDRTAQYAKEQMTELELAYAVTVHKSQGSEFKAVIMPVVNVIPQLCYRNLLYTAVTRARKLLIMTGQKETVYAMVQNNRRTLRYTNQKEMLQEMCDE